MSAELYSSLRLSPTQIRTVEVLPGRWSDNIACTLDVSLDGSHMYEALSYVWGNPNDTISITVNGHAFSATKNLHAALRRLRLNTKPRTLWVDAVCINQLDLDEKAQQVRMMQDIYSKASEVQVYLGESLVLDTVPCQVQETWDEPPREVWHRDGTRIVRSRGTTPVVVDPSEGLTDQARLQAFFERQNNASANNTQCYNSTEALREADAGAFAIISLLAHGRCLRTCLRSETHNPVWVNTLHALQHLAQQSWWTRVWVLQEAILGKKLTAIYGDIVAPLDLIEDGGSTIPRHREKDGCCRDFWNMLPVEQQDILSLLSKHTKSLEAIREWHFYIADDQTKQLQYYLELTRSRQASDDRDKVYGLLGLLEGCPNPIEIYPNYRRSTADLYAELAFRFICYQNNLDILTSYERKNPASKIPTWVPNWALPLEADQDHMMLTRRISHYYAARPERDFAQLHEGCILGVTGVNVDKVLEILGPFQRSTNSLVEIIKEIFRLCQPDDGIPATYPNGGLLYHAVWNTLFGGLIAGYDQSTPIPFISFRETTISDEFNFRIAYGVWQGLPRSTQTPDLYGTPISEQRMESIAHWCAESFWLANDNRTFFKTEKGYIGFGPRDMQTGDDVCVLIGSRVPSILRPAAVPNRDVIPEAATEGSCYNLVGYCYSHGLMDGEAVGESVLALENPKKTESQDTNSGRQFHIRKIFLV